jgi:hypothetical protein
MTRYIKILIIFVLILLANPIYSQNINNLDNLQASVKEFSKNMAMSLPFNSTIGLNWSDAYIGQLVGIPPGLGVGATVGATTVNLNPINKLLSQFYYELPDSQLGFPLPGYTIEARIGGFIIPFDIGVKFGYLNMDSLASFDVALDYMLIGGDIRFSVINSKIAPVNLSVGLGYNHLRGGITTTVPMGTEDGFSFYVPGDGSYILSMDDPELGVLWKTDVLEAKAQVSFPLVVITPYVGLGVSYAWSTVGYRVNSSVNVSGTGGKTLDDLIETLNQYGLSNIRADKGFNSMVNVSDWNTRVFGGISLNLLIFRFDFTAMYNVRDSNYGATIGLRIQL